MLDKPAPHQSALRDGRFSIPGATYAITSCIRDRKSRLVLDPLNPRLSADRVKIIISSLKWLHEQRRITLQAYTIMPDHVHLLFVLEEGHSLFQVMSSFGSFTARHLNALDHTHGPFWQDNFYDHLVRNEEDLTSKVQYLLANPVRKGYVLNPEDWPFSEAFPDWPIPATR